MVLCAKPCAFTTNLGGVVCRSIAIITGNIILPEIGKQRQRPEIFEFAGKRISGKVQHDR